jgi:hypothetical protein
MNTKHCTLCRHSYFSKVLLLSFIIISCKGSEDVHNRPSPLTADSISIQGKSLKIIYSSPAVRKRSIWGDLVKYDRIWRTGANEATVLDLGTDVLIGGQSVPAGKYAVFTRPGENEWLFILNREWDQWGSYNYDEGQDVLRLSVIPYKSSEMRERMQFILDADSLSFGWEYLRFSISMSIN